MDAVRPRTFHGIEGDASDVPGVIERYTSLLERYAPVACVLAIGENGHLAFNDPPANYTTAETTGDAEFSEVAFDGVFVPDENLIGPLNTRSKLRSRLVLTPARHQLEFMLPSPPARSRRQLHGPSTHILDRAVGR